LGGFVDHCIAHVDAFEIFPCTFNNSLSFCTWTFTFWHTLTILNAHAFITIVHL